MTDDLTEETSNDRSGRLRSDEDIQHLAETAPEKPGKQVNQWQC